MPLGRMIERLMVLDAVLGDRTVIWLGTETDKRSYFIRQRQWDIYPPELPRLTFGSGARSTIRYFPDKLPIGVQRDKWDQHVFLYLVTSPVPMDFRLFLLRHSDLLQCLVHWTIRVLVPEPFTRAVRQFGHAAREHLATPLAPEWADELEWFFPERQRRQAQASGPSEDRFRQAASLCRAPRFRALYRFWQHEGTRPSGWLNRTSCETRSRSRMARSNSSGSRTSISISPPWLASPDCRLASDNEGDNLPTEVVSVCVVDISASPPRLRTPP